MGSLGILFPPWLTKRRTRLEGACPHPFPSFAATSSIAVSQLGGGSRLKRLCLLRGFLKNLALLLRSFSPNRKKFPTVLARGLNNTKSIISL